jgi:hypothetical protein
VEGLLAQEIPQVHMGLLRQIAGTGVAVKSSGYMPGAKAMALSSIQMMM